MSSSGPRDFPGYESEGVGPSGGPPSVPPPPSVAPGYGYPPGYAPGYGYPLPPAKKANPWLIAGIAAVVVVFGIAMLAAIAVPSFNQGRSTAQGRMAQSSVRNALTVEEIVYIDSAAYTTDTAEFSLIEQSLKWGEFGDQDEVLVAVGDRGRTVCLAVKGRNGTTYFARASHQYSEANAEYRYTMDTEGREFAVPCTYDATKSWSSDSTTGWKTSSGSSRRL